MKKKFFLISVIISIALISGAQVPQKFNYQAIVRDSQNEVLSSQTVGFKVSILKETIEGEEIYSESHNITTSPYGMADLLIGSGEILSGDFSAINWGDDLHFMKIEIDPEGGSSYEHLGTTQLISVPYALYSANVSSPTRKFTIQAEPDHALDSPLFEVKNKEGQTVFAVYPEGTRVYILDDNVKGIKGGFAVGGYNRTGKGATHEYLRITPDSIRLYINESPAKGVKGGFAVGGYNRTGKGVQADYFNISGQNSAELIPGENRIGWYPQRNAFMAGNVLVESADSVGQNSMATGFQSKAIGDFSEAFGHKSVSRGNYSTAIGNNATSQALNSVSIGNHARAADTSSFAMGTGAVALGSNSYAIGSSGIDSSGVPTGNTRAVGKQSFAFGVGSVTEGFGAFSIGTKNRAIGDYSIAIGYKTKTTGMYSTTLGKQTTASGTLSIATGLHSEASGVGSTAMGWWATASGYKSVAFGNTTTASGTSSTAMGSYSVASGGSSTAIGKNAVASGLGSFALGNNVIAKSLATMVVGRWNDTVSTSYPNNPDKWRGIDPLFTIGSGSSDSTRRNAMIVKKNGEIYFPGAYLDTVNIGKTLVIREGGKIGYLASSQRYKTNISPMNDIGWLYELRPVNFSYKSDASGKNQYGLIAEEVEAVNPSFVSYNQKGEPETVSYGQLVTPLLKAIQEQQKLIESLQEQNELIEALQKRIEALENN